MSGDFDAFAEVFHLPQTLGTIEGTLHINTRDDLRAVFDRVHQNFVNRGVTHLLRFCEAASFRSETQMEATHVSHFMVGQLRINDPFPTFTTFEWIDNGWKITKTEYALDRSTPEGRAMIEASGQGPAPDPHNNNA